MATKSSASVVENARLTPVRRANLCLLTAGDGAVTRLAGVIGVTPGSVSALKNRSDKSIGRRFCTSVEAALGLSAGWMDVLQLASDIPEEVRVLLSQTARGSSKQRLRIEQAVEQHCAGIRLGQYKGTKS